MRYIKLKHRSIAMPENWNELTLEQLLTLAVYGMRKLTVQQLKVSMLLSSMGARVMKKVGDGEYRLRFGLWRRSVTISAEEVTALADSYSFIIARRDDIHHIDSQLTRDHFPKLRVGGRRLHGPGDILEHLTYEQFVWSQTYLQRMQTDPKLFTHLLATLWHTGERFDVSRVEHDARLIARLPIPTQIVMMWIWEGSLSFIQQQFPRIFSGEGGGGGNVFESQQRIIDALAGGDMTKKEAVRQGYLYDALISMDESLRQREEQKQHT